MEFQRPKFSFSHRTPTGKDTGKRGTKASMPEMMRNITSRLQELGQPPTPSLFCNGFTSLHRRLVASSFFLRDWYQARTCAPTSGSWRPDLLSPTGWGVMKPRNRGIMKPLETSNLKIQALSVAMWSQAQCRHLDGTFYLIIHWQVANLVHDGIQFRSQCRQTEQCKSSNLKINIVTISKEHRVVRNIKHQNKSIQNLCFCLFVCLAGCLHLLVFSSRVWVCFCLPRYLQKAFGCFGKSQGPCSGQFKNATWFR